MNVSESETTPAQSPIAPAMRESARPVTPTIASPTRHSLLLHPNQVAALRAEGILTPAQDEPVKATENRMPNRRIRRLLGKEHKRFFTGDPESWARSFKSATPDRRSRKTGNRAALREVYA